MNKVAVDAKAKSYWTSYFKSYGELWVRDIHKRVHQAALEKTGAKEIEGAFSPLANSVDNKGLLSIEAAFVGKIDGKDAKGIATATFTADGNVSDFNFCRIN